MSLVLRCVKCSSMLLETKVGPWCPICKAKPAASKDEPDFEEQVITVLTEIRDELRKQRQTRK